MAQSAVPAVLLHSWQQAAIFSKASELATILVAVPTTALMAALARNAKRKSLMFTAACGIEAHRKKT